MKPFVVALFTALALVAPGQALADAVVTLCHQDTESGQGTNLATALKIGGTISFGCGGAATITISRPYDIILGTTVQGETAITLDGNNATSMFVVHGVAFTLQGLTLTRAGKVASSSGVGQPELGGLVRGEGTITIADSTITSSSEPLVLANAQTSDASKGSLAISNSTFANNSGFAVVVVGGGWNATMTSVTMIDNDETLAFNGGTATLRDVTVTHSKALWLSADKVTITRGNFHDNGNANLVNGWMRLGCHGADASCTFTITNSQFSNNAAAEGGAFDLFAGSIMLTGDTFTENSAAQAGGAIAVLQATVARSLSIAHGVFRGNKAGSNGGAIDLGDVPAGSAPTLTGSAVDFANNTAGQNGGGISGNARLTISRGVFVGNVAQGRGGAIALNSGKAAASVIANTLFARNSASTGGGVSAFQASFVNSTFASNIGGGLAFDDGVPLSGLAYTLTNSLFVRNNPANCMVSDLAASHITDKGHNMQFPQRSCGTTITVADPILDPLYAPVAGSPAYDSGDEMACEAPPVSRRDVYNQYRPQGSVCTIGAAEGLPERVVDNAIQKQGGPAGSGGGPGSGGNGGSGSGGTGGGNCGCNCTVVCTASPKFR